MWNFYQPVRVLWGEGRAKSLGSVMEEHGWKRGFMIADAFLVNNGMAARIAEETGGRVAGISSDVEPNPTVQNVDRGAERAKSLGADYILAFGGGSAMDCAKAVAAAVAEDCEAGELLAGRKITRALPVIAIPTTAGTGSEVTAGAVLSDKEKGIKEAIFSPALFPAVALVDPELTYSVPAKVTAATGLDVLAHALDALSSVKADEATDALALRAAKLAIGYLERAVRDGADKEARAAMSKASTIAGLAFSQTGTTGSHACSYILTSRYGVPHGEACAFTMDSWFVINAIDRPRLNDYARELGFADAQGLADWISGAKVRLGMRTKLEELGIKEADLPVLVDASMASGNMANNVAQIGREGVATIFKSKM